MTFCYYQSTQTFCSDTNIFLQLTKNFSKVPFLTSAMDTVRVKMAIAILKRGLGIIHRNLEIKKQSFEVKKLKIKDCLLELL